MTKPRKIGVLTIGQAPRADDTVAELQQVLGPGMPSPSGALSTTSTRRRSRATAPSPGSIC